MSRGVDWVGLVWLGADAVLFVGALFVAFRNMRRIRWAPALVRRTFANFGWYALLVTVLMVAGYATSPSNTVFGALFYGSIMSAFHLLIMASILVIALMVALPVGRDTRESTERDG